MDALSLFRVTTTGPESRTVDLRTARTDGRRYRPGQSDPRGPTDRRGRSFGRPVVVVRGPFADHPWLAIDPTRAASSRRQQTLYPVWANPAGLSFSRSLDDGRHFAPPHTIPHTGLLVGDPVLAAGPPGRIDVIYYASSPDRRPSHRVISSANGGQAFGEPHTVALTPGQTLLYGKGVPSSRVAAAVDPLNVYLSQSVTHGASFRRPLQVNGRPFNPALGIKTVERGQWWIGDYQGLAAGPSTVYACWNDTRSGRLEVCVAAEPVT